MRTLLASFLLLLLSLVAQAQNGPIRNEEVSIHLQRVTGTTLQIKFKNESGQTNIFRYILTVERPELMEYDFVDGGNSWGPTLQPNQSFTIEAYLKRPLAPGEHLQIWMLNERYQVIAEEILLTY